MRRYLTYIVKVVRVGVVLFLFGIVLKYLAWAFIGDKYTIPTLSMAPTLNEGDKIVVNKLLMGARIYTDFNFDADGVALQSFRTKGLRSPMHNDIVVFNRPYHKGAIKFVINEVYCKRIVALPGDTLSIKKGVYCNNNYEGVLGLESEQSRLSMFSDSMLLLNTYDIGVFKGNLDWTIKDFGPYYVPRAGDLINITSKEAVLYKPLLEWELGKKISYDWINNSVYADGEILTQHRFLHNYYFMAGDNVLDSNDSRYWGLVPEEYIVGIVNLIYSKEKEQWLRV